MLKGDFWTDDDDDDRDDTNIYKVCDNGNNNCNDNYNSIDDQDNNTRQANTYIETSRGPVAKRFLQSSNENKNPIRRKLRRKTCMIRITAQRRHSYTYSSMKGKWNELVQ